MAERVRLSIPAGERARHLLPWDDPSLGSRGCLGTLDWSVVVLDGQTVDLEVTAQLQGGAAAGTDTPGPGLILLQEVARGGKFHGTFDPSSDERLAQEGATEEAALAGGAASAIEAVAFDFGNAFSWFTGKEVELVAVRRRPTGPPPSLVPRLPALAPLAAPARRGGQLGGATASEGRPDLAQVPPAGAPAPAVTERERLERFLTRLDDCLAAAEARRPAAAAASALLGGLTSQLALLRGLCKQAESQIKLLPQRAAATAAGRELTAEVLRAQDDRTSGAVIDFLAGDPVFQDLAKRELGDILERDREDGEKLALGIAQAIQKGVLPGDLVPPEYDQIDVMGRSADQVAEEILAKLPKDGGCVVILVGLSGTGKGTTVEKIRQKVANASTWSNGNCFRALTLLAVTHCEQQGLPAFDPACLTPENLASWAGMLEFGQFDGDFDIRINGLGIDAKVSQVANTLLKEPRVSRNIPTVAKETQGEVVRFAGDAVRKMGEAGTVVLLEGREQTLNFIPSPYRFCLTVSDTTVIGARRAAQRIAALAASKVEGGADVAAAVRAALAEVAGTGT